LFDEKIRGRKSRDTVSLGSKNLIKILCTELTTLFCFPYCPEGVNGAEYGKLLLKHFQLHKLSLSIVVVAVFMWLVVACQRSLSGRTKNLCQSAFSLSVLRSCIIFMRLRLRVKFLCGSGSSGSYPTVKQATFFLTN
jgi:hypothetical protein